MLGSKSTSDVLVILKLVAEHNHFSATSGWSFSWVSIENLRRLIVIIRNVVICVLLIIECNLDIGFLTYVVRWRITVKFGGI